NLPQSDQFKAENIILIEHMPGPKESKTDEINNYLEPMVDELIQLYCGIRIPTFKSPAGEVIRAALMMVACNIPAARKTSRFTCNRHFTCLDSTNKVDFCGLKESEWCHRNCEKNRLHAEEWKNAVTISERQHLEIKNDVRWSQLHRLGYFDLVCGTIIDLMHNLFL
ncbi:hypothetical protein PHYBLDRAFT_102322, partial [Phycomyces blakesleeanus NRRL 1555(-)]